VSRRGGGSDLRHDVAESVDELGWVQFAVQRRSVCELAGKAEGLAVNQFSRRGLEVFFEG